MEYNRPSCPEKFRDIAIAMGENVEGLSVREASIAAVEAIAAIADETRTSEATFFTGSNRGQDTDLGKGRIRRRKYGEPTPEFPP